MLTFNCSSALMVKYNGSVISKDLRYEIVRHVMKKIYDNPDLPADLLLMISSLLVSRVTKKNSKDRFGRSIWRSEQLRPVTVFGNAYYQISCNGVDTILSDFFFYRGLDVTYFFQFKVCHFCCGNPEVVWESWYNHPHFLKTPKEQRVEIEDFGASFHFYHLIE
ncbi:U1 putative protein [Porton virus]|uniref:U1 putative protein n=1 Tax=Porton virus TaxID=1272940 RepID=UPI002481AFEF|nr:U1 putative protein [Porton virus]UAX43310.1 U1 putative protein [Porton virus]